jgi:hypothetical protein
MAVSWCDVTDGKLPPILHKAKRDPPLFYKHREMADYANANPPCGCCEPVFGVRDRRYNRHCERSEAIPDLFTARVWIASLRSQ